MECHTGGCPPPPPTKGAIMGKNEIYRWENLVGPFLVHKLSGPKPPPPLPSPGQKTLWHWERQELAVVH